MTDAITGQHSRYEISPVRCEGSPNVNDLLLPARVPTELPQSLRTHVGGLREAGTEHGLSERAGWTHAPDHVRGALGQPPDTEGPAVPWRLAVPGGTARHLGMGNMWERASVPMEGPPTWRAVRACIPATWSRPASSRPVFPPLLEEAAPPHGLEHLHREHLQHRHAAVGGGQCDRRSFHGRIMAIRQDAVADGGNHVDSLACPAGSTSQVYSGRLALRTGRWTWQANYTRSPRTADTSFPEWGREPLYTFLTRERTKGPATWRPPPSTSSSGPAARPQGRGGCRGVLASRA